MTMEESIQSKIEQWQAAGHFYHGTNRAPECLNGGRLKWMGNADSENSSRKPWSVKKVLGTPHVGVAAKYLQRQTSVGGPSAPFQSGWDAGFPCISGTRDNFERYYSVRPGYLYAVDHDGFCRPNHPTAMCDDWVKDSPVEYVDHLLIPNPFEFMQWLFSKGHLQIRIL